MNSLSKCCSFRYCLVDCLCCLVFFQGERDGPIYFLDSSKIPTPTSRYGGYHSKNYSGSITPLSSYSYQFEMMHLESLRDKLNRLSHEKGSSRFPLFG